MKKLRISWVGLLLVFVGSVALDQATKLHAQRDLLRWESSENHKLYSGKSFNVTSVGAGSQFEEGEYLGLDMTYSRNTGAAFSMLADLDDKIRVPFFYGVTLFAVIAIALFFKSTPLDHRMTRFGLIMILSGAIGNFIDRLRWGYVVDFIDVEWRVLGWQHDFAIFNVADVAINIGVICYILDIMRISIKEKREQRRNSNKESGAELPVS
jgi:signal peptidase II